MIESFLYQKNINRNILIKLYVKSNRILKK